MNPTEFCYWLQGYFELNGNTKLSEHQGRLISNHLNLVFLHSIDTPDPTGAKQAAHDGSAANVPAWQTVGPASDQLIRC